MQQPMQQPSSAGQQGQIQYVPYQTLPVQMVPQMVVPMMQVPMPMTYPALPQSTGPQKRRRQRGDRRRGKDWIQSDWPKQTGARWQMMDDTGGDEGNDGVQEREHSGGRRARPTSDVKE